MNKLISIAVVLFFGIQLQAQRAVELTEALKNGQEVYVDFKFADDIKVEQWSGSQLKIEAQVNIDDGEGNDSFSLKVDKSSSRIKIYSDFNNYFDKKWNDRKRRSSINNYNSVTDIDYVVYVPANTTIRLKSISGSVFSDSYTGEMITDLISGDVTIKDYNGELRLKTVSGDLDVTMNKARINGKTLTGTIYSDLDIDMEKEGRRSHGHNKIQGNVNNGGDLVVMETVSGNIYMRKG